MSYLYDMCPTSMFHVLRIGIGAKVVGLVLLHPTSCLFTGRKTLHVLFAYAHPGYNVSNYIATKVPEYAWCMGYSRVTATLVRKGWLKYMRKYGWTEESPSVSIGTSYEGV